MRRRTNKNDFAVHLVLDRSGSMGTTRDEAIGSVNGYVEKLKEENPGALYSLTLFDDVGIDVIVDNVPVADVPELTREVYIPRGMTPLHDAIGKTVASLEKTTAKNKILVVLTDGLENCSREFNGQSIKKLLDSKQSDDSWLVIYLGANQDAISVGGQLGYAVNNSMTFAMDKLDLTMAATAAATNRFMHTGMKCSADFTDSERTDAS